MVYIGIMSLVHSRNPQYSGRLSGIQSSYLIFTDFTQQQSLIMCFEASPSDPLNLYDNLQRFDQVASAEATGGS